MEIKDVIYVKGVSLDLSLDYENQEYSPKIYTIKHTDKMVENLSELTNFEFERYYMPKSLENSILFEKDGLKINPEGAKLLYKSKNIDPSSVSLIFSDDTKVDYCHGTPTETDFHRMFSVDVNINDKSQYNSIKLKSMNMEILEKIDRCILNMKNYTF
jgi:hypothetical protein